MKIFKYIFSITNNLDKKIFRILGLKLTFSRFKAQRIKSLNNKPTIALQLNQMDKGGLEEVVLQIATNNKIRRQYNIVIICEYTNKGYLANIAKKYKIPVYSFFSNTKNIPQFVKTLNIKIAHFHYNVTGIDKYKKLGVKTLYTIHNNYIWSDSKEVAERKTYYQYIDKFIAVSSQVKEYFCKKFNIANNKVIVIPNGINFFDTTKITPFSKVKLKLKNDDFVMINVASFNPNKYHFAQLKALSEINKKYKNIKLLLIGNIHDKLYYQKIKEMIVDLKLKNNVRILDYAPKKQIYKYLKMADCFIMTSLTEGFGLAISEAMLCGKPLIITNTGAARDFINNNDIGILISHAFKDMQNLSIWKVIEDYNKNIFYFDNVNEIVQAIENIYLNKTKWKDKALLGINKIKNEFNVERFGLEHFKLYKGIL